MNLATTYLGWRLDHPLMVGASPLTDTLDGARRLEDAAAQAVVLSSLFQEQIEGQPITLVPYGAPNSSAAGTPHGAREVRFPFGPAEYLEHIHKLKHTTGLIVIASLNGSRAGPWTQFARDLARAGADAIELNPHYLATDLFEPGSAIETAVVEIARAVKDRAPELPLAVKLAPFFSSLPHLARQLDEAGVDGLVLFGSSHLPQIDLNQFDVVPRLRLSDPSELPERLLWLGVLAGRVVASLAATGGAHTSEDALKALMAGADVVQVVSALLQHGPQHLRTMRDGIARWLEAHQFDDLAQVRRCTSLSRVPDPQAFERARYAAALQSWTGTELR